MNTTTTSDPQISALARDPRWSEAKSEARDVLAYLRRRRVRTRAVGVARGPATGDGATEVSPCGPSPPGLSVARTCMQRAKHGSLTVPAPGEQNWIDMHSTTIGTTVTDLLTELARLAINRGDGSDTDELAGRLPVVAGRRISAPAATPPPPLPRSA